MYIAFVFTQLHIFRMVTPTPCVRAAIAWVPTRPHVIDAEHASPKTILRSVSAHNLNVLVLRATALLRIQIDQTAIVHVHLVRTEWPRRPLPVLSPRGLPQWTLSHSSSTWTPWMPPVFPVHCHSCPLPLLLSRVPALSSCTWTSVTLCILLWCSLCQPLPALPASLTPPTGPPPCPTCGQTMASDLLPLAWWQVAFSGRQPREQWMRTLRELLASLCWLLLAWPPHYQHNKDSSPATRLPHTRLPLRQYLTTISHTNSTSMYSRYALDCEDLHLLLPYSLKMMVFYLH